MHINICWINLTLIFLAVGSDHPKSLNCMQTPQLICGHWIVARAVPTTFGADPASAKPYFGFSASYQDAEMTFGPNTVMHPRYKVIQLSRRDFFVKFHLPLKELGVTGGQITEVDVLDSSRNFVVAPGSMTFIRNRNDILTYFDGVFMELVRKDP